MTIKPVGVVVEIYGGGDRISRTRVVPEEQLPSLMDQLRAIWDGTKHKFELVPVTLCRHDEAMAEIERLTASRDAYVKQRDELQRLHDEQRGEIERLQAEKADVTAAYGEKCDALLDAVIEREELKVENAALRQQLEGNGTTLYAVISDIRHKSGVGMKPMLSELADAIADRIAEARNKALDEACELVATITRDELKDSEGVSQPDYFDEGTSAAYEAIRALKDSAP